MTTKIIKGDDKRVFHHPATGLSFCYPDRYLIYVEGYGYWGAFYTRKAAVDFLKSEPDFSSFQKNLWHQEVEPQTFNISTVGQLREFMKRIENLSDDTPIHGDYYASSGFEGFTIHGDQIIAETYS